MENKNSLYTYTLRLADDSMILGQRTGEWCGHGPILEEDIALTNVALDLIGQATNFYEHAAAIANNGKTADDLAFLRVEREFFNILLVEQPNGHYGDTIARQFFFDAFRKLYFEQLIHSKDEQLSAIAEKSLKETKYHLKHSSEWMIRLGDGTELSHDRIQESVNDLWKFTSELFYMDEVDRELIAKGIAVDLESLRQPWTDYVNMIFNEATITKPASSWNHEGGRKGIHSEHMGFILAEMQYMQRAYPGMEW
ncbi:MAG: phenylacetate-CoA oxygenase subunit PaaC [Flavobacteriia bacterium]|nr:phenylacetate-CoA oxygenase subunit PaaC [Flavobacteriia bacterium]OJX36140.1 MAG: phenylacetate-CoA oxygenase subunit PaaI [Flavobacteriia bacterium 40-80]